MYVGYIANTAPLYIWDSSTVGFLYLGVGVAGTHPPHLGRTTVVLIFQDTKQQSQRWDNYQSELVVSDGTRIQTPA